jgi:hypothetical protein
MESCKEFSGPSWHHCFKSKWAKRRKCLRENQSEGQQAVYNINQCKKLTDAGEVFKSGYMYLGPDVLKVADDKLVQKDEVMKERK